MYIWNFYIPCASWSLHYNDVIMGTIASQITSLTIVYSTVYSDADQRKHQSSASLAFVRGIHRGPMLKTMIARYDDHPSIRAIKNALPTGNSFSFTDVTANETYNLLMKMDCKKSTGFDDIPCKLLKIGSAPLAPPICNLVNLMFMESCFPDILKYAEVAALFKRLDNLNKGNYRPVSVLTALSKVFEKVSCVQMSSYVEFIFSKFLSGFRPTYSCQTILLKMIEDWKQSIYTGKWWARYQLT